ncbi:MAG TPA: hypothetical protein VFE10_01380 [Phenylobacterium sp.]|jgi:hypothetical protein|nr:hypothetical protein [Phenylobacterium sp.]
MFGFSLTAFLRALLLWLLFVLAESAQGALRRLLFRPEIELAMRQISVALGVAVIFAITWLAWRWLRLRSAGAALTTGVLWVGLTAVFEIGLGRLLGASWDILAADYDPRHGGFMALGLLAMALIPWAVWRIKARDAPT